MAGPVDLSSFDKAVPLNQFDAPAKAAPVALGQFDDPGVPVSQAPQGAPPPIEDQVVQAVTDAIPESVKGVASEIGQYIGQSPVGTALKALNKPMQAVSAGVTYGLDKTLAPGIQAELNPKGEVFPELAYHDIINFAAPTNDAVEEKLKKYGFSNTLVTAGRLGYATAKAGVGLVADIVGDPVNLVTAGAVGAIKKGASLANKVPVVAKASEKTAVAASKMYDRTLGVFDYRTGYQDVDRAASMASGLKRGDNIELYSDFYKPIQDLNLTKDENLILSKAIESTPNAATKAEIFQTAKKIAPTLNDGRLEQIVDAGVSIKAANAEDLAERVGAGLLPESQVAEKTIENYLVHRISPEAQKWARKNPELAAEIQTNILGKEVDAVTNGSWLKDFDSGKFKRTIQKPLNEANAMMKGMTKGAVDEWFISDPAIATMMKRAETRKLVRDKQLLDVMKEHAVDGRDAKKLGLQGYRSIKHDYFDGKNFEVNTPSGTKLIPFNEVYFPEKISDKIGYMIQPREIGNFNRYVDGYNQMFRTFALAKPDYYAQNWGENFFKNYVVGVKLSDYADAMKLTSEKGSIMIKGRPVSATEVMKQAQRYGIDSGGQFREGLDSVLFSGKKLVKDGALKSTAKAPVNFLKFLRHQGEKGENYTRRALFINRLKQGMSVEDAVLDVEKYLFDFSRNTKWTDRLRRFYDPFIQAAVKTAMITPELLLKNPKAYNLLSNNMPAALNAAMQDPVTTQEVLAVLPEYRKYQDPIVGPLLTGNDWLYKIFTNKDTPEHLGGKTALLFKAPIGLDILNRFALWDSQVWKNSGTVSPILKSLVIAFGGKDPFTGKNMDVVSSEPDMARRLNKAMWNLAESAAPMPNTVGAVKQWLGVGDPQFFTPLAVRALQANFGKFVTVTNLDKEYFFRNMALAKAHKELTTELRSTIVREQTGRTADMATARNDWVRDISVLVNKPFTSARIYAQVNENQKKMMLTKLAGAGLMNELRAVEIVKNLRDIDAQVKQLNENYVTTSEYRLQVLAKARAEGDAEMEKEIVPEANREPQSMGDPMYAREDELKTAPRGRSDAEEGAIRDRLNEAAMMNRDHNVYNSPEQYRQWQFMEREKAAKRGNLSK